MPKSSDKAIRPVLIASRQTLTLYRLCLKRLLIGLADHSVPSVLVCPQDADVQSIVYGPVEVLYHPVFELPLADRLGHGRLVEQLARFKPAVIHSLCQTRATLAGTLSRDLGIPYLVSYHARQRRGLSYVSRRCSGLLCPSEAIMESVRTAYPRAADRIAVQTLGTYAQEACCCFSRPRGPACLVMIHPTGRLDPYATIFHAIHDLAREGHDLNLVIMSQGREDSPLYRIAKALGINDRITLLPDLDPWRSVLGAGDIFLQPRPTAWFNPYLLEAMGVGLAVAADKACRDDLIRSGETALVFESDNPVDVRATLKRLLDQRDLARRIAQTAQDYVRGRHSVSGMVEGFMAAYRRAAEASRPEAVPA